MIPSERAVLYFRRHSLRVPFLIKGGCRGKRKI
nr:MAG TPA: hypothetical protein [Caudoviricetes sp.]